MSEQPTKFYNVTFETGSTVTAEQFHQLLCLLLHETGVWSDEMSDIQAEVLNVGEVLEVTKEHVA